MTIRIPSMMERHGPEGGGEPAAAGASEAVGAEQAEGSGEGNTPLSSPFAHETIGFDPDASGFRHRHSGALLLLLVFAVACGTLLAMRSLGQAGKIALLDIKIDYPLDAAGAARGLEDQQVVLQNLRTSGVVRQVPLEEVQMNPFEWRGLGPTEAARGPVGATPEETARRELEARRRETQQAFAALHLNSVIGGAVPVASVSGEMVKVGGTVAGRFTVRAIDGRSVTLVADDQTFTLTLGR